MRGIASVVIVLLSCSLFGQAAQWRGELRDGTYNETGLLKEWPAEGPELLLQIDGIGGGYSTPVFYDGLVYVTGRKDSMEYLSAVSLEGEILWQTYIGKAWMVNFKESRNTPSIVDGQVYISSSMGEVNRVDAKTGEVLWVVDVHSDFGGEMHKFGMAESMVVTEDAVLSSPVGEQTVMVALDREDGSLMWQSESLNAQRSYASPVMVNHNGQDIVLMQTNDHLVGVDPSNGAFLFVYNVTENHSPRDRTMPTNTVLYRDGEMFVTSGYNNQSVMLQLAEDAKSVSVKWTNDILDVHHHGVVEVDGYIYGANWISNGKGNWVCLNWETGDSIYEEEWKNKGAIITADGMLYLLEEKRGFVGLAKASPEGLNVVSSFQMDQGKGPRWAHPAIYDKKLFLRHGEVLLVYGLGG